LEDQALVLGARGVLAVPCPPTGAAKVSIVRIGVAVRQAVAGSSSVVWNRKTVITHDVRSWEFERLGVQFII
jgi:hypothetical protein